MHSDLKSGSPILGDVVENLLELFRKQGPDLVEDIKYGGIAFLSDGEVIGGIHSYKDHVSVEFSNGAQFDDPRELLEGKGKFRRHLKSCGFNDIRGQDAEFFFQQAC